MTTTALRIEILIIGFQASILSIFLLVESPGELIAIANKFKDIAAPATLILIGWCYSLGAAIDGITAAIEDPKLLWLWRWPSRWPWQWTWQWPWQWTWQWPSQWPLRKVERGSLSAITRLNFPEAIQEFVRMDYELRLLRATSFNLLMFAVLSILPIPIFKCKLSLLVSALIGVLGFVIGLAWYRRKLRIHYRREEVYKKANVKIV